MDISFDLEKAKEATRLGDHSKARSILRKVLEQEPRNAEAWLLFAEVAMKPEHAVQCLERVLILDPGNIAASAQLENLRSGQPYEAFVSEESNPAAPMNLTTTPVDTQHLPPAQTEVPARVTTIPTTKTRASSSKLEKILIAIAGLLFMCLLCVLGFTLLRDPLMGMTASRSTPNPADYAAVIYENIRASNAEDMQAYMATIHPDSPAYATTEEMLGQVFETYDLSYRVSGINVVEENSREVQLSFVLVTRKINGPAFRDNQVSGIMILRKDGDAWKIYDQKVENIQYLD
jgi:hypothetical protein